ncbi:MAG: Trifunctional nucleotide phosphoesterase protein YfkN precursor [Deltaproteobacteria bacterium ADurb.Bin151]|jgi:5'-nucleotidase|nr:bifunctional metallophosphatase/5'-nucleotidase [Smithella sp.]OQB55953.1 MAG: Trifunctional nucleotide phosphoesterase protein YfkN precursor [Deltaproteobacteria bacterium ADurb.Bin151]HNZ11835.1 bifunctional UDP-sugar hydrolase/5'-nucleotidase [Smithellaceae bacterium]HOQ43117.1 bifunctional UDP-sugar hydrolase/5'-nucleotidase [Smithellaceae bacterium]HPL65918.1 bifunctional UDP-sugar hydrolase/5'-nucleotidase [Smithellaceae bacterium]
MKLTRITIILVTVLFFTNNLSAEEQLLTIIHTNDMHSHVQGFSPEIDYRPFAIDEDKTLGGWSRVATVIKNIKKERFQPVLVVDAGDYTMGSLFHMLNREEAFELRLLSAMGYDVVTLGNHEFDLKPAGLAATLKTVKLRGPVPQIVFAGAVFDRKNPILASLENAFLEAGVKNYTVLERGKIRIGIFGMLGKDAIEVSPFAKPLTFRDPVDVARDMVDVLRNREKVDLVICLSHGGLNDDPKKSEDELLARKVKGIDVIVSGHTHTKLDKSINVNGTIIVQAWCYGKQVGVLDIAVNSGKVQLKKYTVVPVNSSIAGDEKIQAMIDAFKQMINRRLLAPARLSYDQVIAETKFDLSIRNDESPLGNLLADSIRWYVNSVDSDINDPSSRVVVAVESNGVIRDDLLRGVTGKVTVGDLFRTIPLGIGVDNTMAYPLLSFYLYGYELKKALEILTSIRPIKGDDYYLQISGLRFTYNPRRIIFDRVTDIETGSEEEGYQPLDYSKSNKKLYRVAANIYNASFLKLVGSFTYSMLEIVPKDKNGRPLAKLSAALVDGNKSLPGIQELKEWQGVIQYVRSFPDTNVNGLPDIPEKYRGKLGRIVEKPSINPVNLVSRGSEPTIIVLAAIGLVAFLLIMTVMLILLRRKAKKAGISVYKR